MFRRLSVALSTVLTTSFVAAAGARDVPLRNWSVPTIQPNTAVPTTSSFVPLAPCRVYDSRLQPAGKITGGTSRTIDVDGAPCGASPTSTAYSLNITVTGSATTTSKHFLTAYPTGTTRPTASNINYTGGMQIANTVIVRGGTSGDIDVYVSLTTDVIIDINGYYTEPVITGVIAGTGLTGGGTSGQVTLAVNFSGTGAATTAARSDHTHYARTIIVSPVGTYAQNGAALQAALANITDAASDNRYLIKVEPGIYDVSAGGKIIMKSYVDIEGSGELATIVTRSGAAIDYTIQLDAYATLRAIFIEAATSGASVVVGATGTNGGYLDHVRIRATSATATSTALSVSGGDLDVRDCTLVSDSTQSAFGFVPVTGSTSTIARTTITATGGAGGYAIYSYGGTHEIRDSVLSGSTDYAHAENSTVHLGNVKVSGALSGSGITCVGVYTSAFVSPGINTCP